MVYKHDVLTHCKATLDRVFKASGVMPSVELIIEEPSPQWPEGQSYVEVNGISSGKADADLVKKLRAYGKEQAGRLRAEYQAEVEKQEKRKQKEKAGGN